MDSIVAIRRESDRFYAVADSADPALPVPSCPEWTVADLVWHLGEVHWFWATDVEMRATDPDDVERTKPQRPADYAGVIAWGRLQAERLLRVLESTPDDVVVWTWALEDSDHTVGFVRRHQVQEAAVHRWDIEQAATPGPNPIEATIAADAIDEMLAITLPWCVHSDKPLPGSVHIHCTDTAGEWLIHADGRVDPVHAKGDVAIRGTASDLLLGLYKRVPISRIDVIGDATLAGGLISRINTD